MAGSAYQSPSQRGKLLNVPSFLPTPQDCFVLIFLGTFRFSSLDFQCGHFLFRRIGFPDGCIVIDDSDDWQLRRYHVSVPDFELFVIILVIPLISSFPLPWDWILFCRVCPIVFKCIVPLMLGGGRSWEVLGSSDLMT